MSKVINGNRLLILFMSVLTLVAQSLVFLPTPTVSALTPAEEEICYQELNGYEEPTDTIEEEAPPLSAVQIKACVDSKVCRTELIYKDLVEYRKYTCNKTAATATERITASEAETAPIVKYFCGNKPADTTSSTALRYNDCKNDVRTSYAKCKYTGGSATSSIVDTPENIANCLYDRLKGYLSTGQKASDKKATVAAIQKTVVSGQKDSGQILAAAATKQDCIDAGGSWDPSQATPCVQSTPDTTDECPLPDDTSMRWLGCSIMSVAAVATEALYGAIQNFLYTPTSMIFDNPSLKAASNGIRNLAIGLVLIAGLAMVIAQATGSDLVDAYTIRKLLPRIGVAIVGIALAWPLLRFAITFTNDIGLLADRLLAGITQLGVNNTGSENEIGTNIFTSLFAAGAAGGAVLFLGAAGVISLAGTILLALLVGLLVLAIRQLVIMVCVLLAPLAIAAYVLPGTQKLWSFWKTTLITTLMMFPIIMFFLASGKAFATVLGGADSTTMSLLAIIVFIAPYFLLPFAFKLAGGLMSTIFSIANDKNRGMFDRLKKGRQEAVSSNVGKIRSGSRYAGGNERNLRGRLNRGLANTANAPGAILSSGNAVRPGNWKAATRNATTTRSMAEMEKNLKENPNYASWSGDDDLNRAAAESHDEASLRSALRRIDPQRFANERDMDNAVARIQTVRRQMSAPAFQQMTTLQAIAGGTAYKTAGEAWAAVARAGQNDDAITASLVAKGRSAAMSGGRVDMGGGSFGQTLKAVGMMQAELRNNGSISTQTQTAASDLVHQSVYQSQGGATLVHSSMKASAVSEMAPEIVTSVVEAQRTGDREFAQSLASVSAVYDGLKGSSPEKARIIANSVMNERIDLNNLTASQRTMLQPAITLATQNAGGQPVTEITYQQAIEGLRGNQEFQEMSREYAQQVAAVQAQGQIPPPGAPLGGQVGALNTGPP